jgi:hypothetical protein
MSQAASVIDELESVLAAGSSDRRRTEILRRVTDLFLGNAESFDAEQVGVFDDVLAHLIKQVETDALAELGAKLAPRSSPTMTWSRLPAPRARTILARFPSASAWPPRSLTF